MRACLALLVYSLFTLLLPPAPVRAHEGHDHPAPGVNAAAAAPRGEAHSGDFEIVAILRGEELFIYLDRFNTNEAVLGAAIEVETPAGQVKATEHEGVYRIPAKWPKGGDHYDLIFTVTVGELTEVLPLSLPAAAANENLASASISVWRAAVFALLVALVALFAGLFGARFLPKRFAKAAMVAVGMFGAIAASETRAHEGHDHKNETQVRAGRDVPQRLPDGSIFVPKPVQRLLAIRTALTAKGEHARAIELPGRVVPDPNASGYVQSTLAGRLLPPPNGFPALGTRVEKGQVLAYVSPPIQAIDVSDMRQKEGEILQQIAIVERRVARFERLVESNAVPRTQLEDARTELQSLKERKVALDQIRREPEELVAPASGVIAEANTIAGQLAQPNTVIFQIVDPMRLWVEALSFDAIPRVERASARGHNGHTIDLRFRGSAATLRNQSIAVQFAVEGADERVWVGQFVTVFATLPDKRSGILLPRAAVVRAANGQHVVFEHLSAERFMPREVRIEPFDAENVLVTGGLEEGKRVVIAGAELVGQVR